MFEMIRRDPTKNFTFGVVIGLGIAVGICFATGAGLSMRGLDGNVAFSLGTDFIILIVITIVVAVLLASRSTANSPTQEE